ncbi:MAG: asparaginase [Christensenellales bacterium]
MQRIALLSTGGTIASVASGDGLVPGMRGEDILAACPALRADALIRPLDVFSLDSSNIQPEEWQLLAAAVRGAALDADGIVITHGTDTMAYSASALSFMLQGLDIPVVFTGSQLPLRHPLSDAPGNLGEAFTVAAKAPPGVYVAFHHKVIHGTRAVKLRTLGFDAFDSINAPAVGYFDADGLHMPLSPKPGTALARSIPPEDYMAIDPRVFLLKLMPGTDPEIFLHIIAAGYHGLVIEAFGLGGLHYLRRNLLESLDKLSQERLYTLVTTQCLYEKADFSIYEVGRHVLKSSIYGAHDMTTEAALTKLMWVLGDKEKRLPLLTRRLAHEMGCE